MRARWAALVAVGGGLAGYLAFPTVGIWPLAFVSVAALSIAVDGRRSRTGAWLGLLYGAAIVRAAAALDRGVRRAGALADPCRRRGGIPGGAGRGAARRATPARRAGVDRAAPGCCRRRCATGCRSVASRGDGWRSARPPRRCGGSPRWAVHPWSRSRSPWAAERSASAVLTAPPFVRDGCWRAARSRGRRSRRGSGPRLAAEPRPRRRRPDGHDRAHPGQRARAWPGLRGPRPPGARQPRHADPEAGPAGQGRHPAADRTSCSGRRTRPTSTPSRTAWQRPRSTRRPRRSVHRSWSARSSTVPTRRTARTRASCGRRRVVPGRCTSSGTRCRSASTSRCAAWRNSSARTSTW